MRKLEYTFIIGAFLLAVLACSLVTESPVEPEISTDEPSISLDTVTRSPTGEPDEPTAFPTSPTPEPQAASVRNPEFGVVHVSEGDVLNVRSGPGVENDIIDTLDPHATGITMTGGRQKVGSSMWVEIATATGTLGWVNAHFLTEVIDANTFCNDPEVTALIGKFVSAIQTRDGEVLSKLVSPIDGLKIRVSWWNPEVYFPADKVTDIFDDPTAYDWGVQDGSGFAIQGTFANEILPWMDDILNADFSQHCNDLENGSGPSAGLVIWPFEYQNINYVALYRSAPADQEFDWRTWAVGITYHKGQPNISFMVQYHWEI